MGRNIRTVEKLFVAGLLFILLFMMLHDWIPLGRFNDLEGIRSQHTISEIWFTTAVNTVSALVVLIITVAFVGKTYPVWARIWLVLHIGGILAGAITAWWIPYFFGADQDLAARYQIMFGDTHSFLPERNGIVPNTIHVVFHSVLVLVWLIAIYLAFRKSSPKAPMNPPG